MSKFNNFIINGNGNTVGDRKITNINNNYFGNKPPNANNSNDEVIGLATGLLLGVGAIAWGFYKHIEQVFFYLDLATITSCILASTALVILGFYGNPERKDYYHVFASFILAVSLFGLSALAQSQISGEVIQLSQEVALLEFWRSLSEQGQTHVLTIFGVAFLLAVGAFINWLIGFRQLAYSLADKDECSGFWYKLYQSSGLLKIEYAGSLVLTILGVVFFLLK